MEKTEPDMRAYMTFPREHHAKLHSTNSIDRLIGAILYMTCETMTPVSDNPFTMLSAIPKSMSGPD